MCGYDIAFVNSLNNDGGGGDTEPIKDGKNIDDNDVGNSGNKFSCVFSNTLVERTDSR